MGERELWPTMKETPYHLTLDGTTVNGKVAQVRQEFLSSILALNELKEIGRIVDELNTYSAR